MSDFEIDNDVLEGLDGVSTDDKGKASDSPDRRHVIISLNTGIDKYIGKSKGAIIAFKNVDNPTVYEVSDYFGGKSVKDEDVLEILKEHVKKYGTIDEVIIIGHGKTGGMSSKSLFTSFSDNINRIGIPYMIQYLPKAGKEINQKITNRIVFDGCGTFTDLDDKGVKYYRDLAKQHQIQIVGTTSALFAGKGLHHGRFIQFTPQGEIIRDRLDNRYSPLAIIGSNSEWTDCFLNKTQEEGQELWDIKQRQKELEQKARLKRIELEGLNVTFGPKI